MSLLFFRKPHEIENIWQVGGRPLDPPLEEPLLSLLPDKKMSTLHDQCR